MTRACRTSSRRSWIPRKHVESSRSRRRGRGRGGGEGKVDNEASVCHGRVLSIPVFKKEKKKERQREGKKRIGLHRSRTRSLGNFKQPLLARDGEPSIVLGGRRSRFVSSCLSLPLSFLFFLRNLSTLKASLISRFQLSSRLACTVVPFLNAIALGISAVSAIKSAMHSNHDSSIRG